MKKFNLCVLFVSINFVGMAQTFLKVKDINTNGDANPNGFVKIGNKVFFGATDAANNTNPFITDGTSAGTTNLKYIANGVSNTISNATLVNGKIYFSSRSAAEGIEPYITDGTSAGTLLLKDIKSGNGNSFPKNFYQFGSQVYFNAANTANGSEFWGSDGTEPGTTLVKDINPGPGNNGSLGFFAFNNNLFFQANDGSAIGAELYTTDGTAANTTLFKDINISGSSNPGDFVLLGNKMIFAATDATYGTEPFVTDGTPGGTTLLYDVYTGAIGSGLSFKTILNGKLLFIAQEPNTGIELWSTDGTTGGTSLVKDMYVGPSSSNAADFINYNGKVYFTANNGFNGRELWVTDGTNAGTYMVKDYNPGIGDGFFPSRAYLTIVQNNLYGRATNDNTNFKLVDVTTSNFNVIDIPNSTVANPLNLTTDIIEFNGKILLGATFDASGHEIWAVSAEPNKISTINKQNIELQVYPNPTTNFINVQFINNNTNAVTIKIYNQMGQEVLSHDLENTQSGINRAVIGTQNLAIGNYSLFVISNGQTIALSKLTKQ